MFPLRVPHSRRTTRFVTPARSSCRPPAVAEWRRFPFQRRPQGPHGDDRDPHLTLRPLGTRSAGYERHVTDQHPTAEPFLPPRFNLRRSSVQPRSAPGAGELLKPWKCPHCGEVWSPGCETRCHLKVDPARPRQAFARHSTLLGSSGVDSHPRSPVSAMARWVTRKHDEGSLPSVGRSEG
jgi:hypothetical protein